MSTQARRALRRRVPGPGPAPPRPGRLRAAHVVLANPALRDAQLAAALSRTADLAQLVAVSTYLFGTGGSVGVAAYVVISKVVPVLGVPAVVAATARLGHARLLGLVGLVAAAGSAAMAALVVSGGPAAAVLALAGLVGLALQSWRPIVAALTPSLVRDPEELVAGNAVSGFLDAATMVFGPLLAAVLLVAGPGWALTATVGLLLVGALLAGRLPTPARMAPEPAAGPPAGALRVFLGTPQAVLVGALGLCQTMVRGALNVLVVVFTIRTLGLQESTVGLLLGAIGVGGMLGLPIALRIVGRRRLYRAFGLGLLLWGAPLAVAAAAPHLAVVLVLFAIIGIGNDLVDISAFSALPRAVPDHALPGVMGILEVLFNLGMATGAALAGVLLGLVDARVALLVVGSLLPVVAVLAASRLRRFDAGLEVRDREVELLRGQELFADLPVPVLDVVASRLATVDFAADETVMREGEPGDRYVLIADGRVTITRGGVFVATLGSGDAFGEIALVRGSPRTATVVAVTEVAARTLDPQAFLAALGCDPRARAAAEAVAVARS